MERDRRLAGPLGVAGPGDLAVGVDGRPDDGGQALRSGHGRQCPDRPVARPERRAERPGVVDVPVDDEVFDLGDRQAGAPG